MIAININRLESNKDEDIKYAEINTATYITGCMSDNEIALLKEKWNEKGDHLVLFN